MIFAPLTNWLFSPPIAGRKWYDVILWWEIRRPAYNAILFVAGIVVMLMAVLFMLLPPHPPTTNAESSPDDLGDPGLGLLMMIVFVIAVNLCYSLGWIVELCIYWTDREKLTAGPILLKVGLIFSLGLFALPPLFSICYWLYRIIN